MATAKKAGKKTAATKAPSRPVSKTSVKRVSKATPVKMRSFVPTKQAEPFFTFRISHQTLYWLILAFIVLLLGLWVIGINDKVQRIYDQIDTTNAATDSIPTTPVKKAMH